MLTDEKDAEFEKSSKEEVDIDVILKESPFEGVVVSAGFSRVETMAGYSYEKDDGVWVFVICFYGIGRSLMSIDKYTKTAEEDGLKDRDCHLKHFRIEQSEDILFILRRLDLYSPRSNT